MKKGYRYVNHTADVEFVSHGKDLNALFRNSLLGLFDTVADIKKLAKAKSADRRFRIREEADTVEELLWYALQYALSKSDANGLFSYRVHKMKITRRNGRCFMDAVCIGKEKAVEYSKLDVKGISRFGLEVTETKEGFKTGVVLDV